MVCDLSKDKKVAANDGSCRWKDGRERRRLKLNNLLNCSIINKN